MKPRTWSARRAIAALGAAGAVAAAAFVGIGNAAGPASPGQGHGPDKYTIGLFGDIPYNALGRAHYAFL